MSGDHRYEETNLYEGGSTDDLEVLQHYLGSYLRQTKNSTTSLHTKEISKFQWTEECDKAFQELKNF